MKSLRISCKEETFERKRREREKRRERRERGIEKKKRALNHVDLDDDSPSFPRL